MRSSSRFSTADGSSRSCVASKYALKVSAMVDDETPGSTELAATLLAPIERAREGASKPAKTKLTAPAASPEKTPAAPAAPLLATGTDGP